MFLFLVSGKVAKSTSDFVFIFIFIWLGHCIRYSTLFGSYFIYVLFSSIAFLPFCALILVLIFAEKKLSLKIHKIVSCFVVPFGYSILMFVLSTCNFGYIANMIGYIIEISALTMSLSFLGEYGMTFLFMFILNLIATCVVEKEKLIKLISIILALFLTVIPLTTGFVLLKNYRKADYSIKVSMATSQEMDFLSLVGIDYKEEQQMSMFTNALEQASDDGAELLVLNEEYFYWALNQEDMLLSKISVKAQEYKIPILAGIELYGSDDELSINEAVYFDGEGNILYKYLKNNLVPFIESLEYVDGKDNPACFNTIIGGHNINVAFIICFDINDELLLRNIPSSAELLIAPSWDWDTANIEQRRTHVSSVIHNITVIKHTFDGFSYVSCPNGKIAAVIDFRKKFESVVSTDVPIWKK